MTAASNEAYGVDGTFTFLDNLNFNTYWARTKRRDVYRDADRRPTPASTGRITSHRFEMNYAGDRYGVQLERLVVGDDFNPEVGYVRRDDMRRHYAEPDGRLHLQHRFRAGRSR